MAIQVNNNEKKLTYMQILVEQNYYPFLIVI